MSILMQTVLRLSHCNMQFYLTLAVLTIQIRLSNIPSCKEYSFSSTQLKIHSINSQLTNNIVSRCSCNFSLSHLSNSILRCFDESPQVVTFRTQLLGTTQTSTSTSEVVSYIEQWIESTVGLAVDGLYLTFEKSCPLVIRRLDSAECPITQDTTLESDNIEGIIVGGVLGGVVIIFMAVAVAIVTICFHVRKKKSNENG